MSAIVRRRRWTLMVSVLVGLILGVGVASLRPPVFEGSTLILVGGQATPVTGFVGTADPPSQGRIATEMELLRSTALAKVVVDSLDLQLNLKAPERAPREEIFTAVTVSADARTAEYRLERGSGGRFRVQEVETERTLGSAAPGEVIELPHASLTLAPTARRYDTIEFDVLSSADAVQGLTRALTVRQPGQDVNLIRVSYRGTDPTLVRDVPNVLTANYMALGESVQKSEARSMAGFLREQLDALASQLSASEDRLQSFREAEGVIDPQLEASTQIGQLAQLQAERAELDSERSALASLLRQVESEARLDPSVSPYRRLIAFPTLLRNVVASELLGSLTAAENELAALATRRTAEDPEVQVLQARVADLERQLGSFATTYLQGLTNQVAAMDGTIGRITSTLEETPAKEVQFARLSRQPRVLQEMYDLLQTRLKEAEIAQAVEDRNVRVIESAVLPHEPLAGEKGLIVGLFAMIGLLIGAGRVVVKEYGDTTVHSRADVHAAIGLPVLGLIPRLNAETAESWPRRVLAYPRLLLASRTSSDGAGPSPADNEAPALFVQRSTVVSPVYDAYGQLQANLDFVGGREPKSLLITSALPGDGKTTIATSLAITLSQFGLRVLLIDADLRKGRVHQVFGTPAGPGLSNLLSDDPVFEGTLRSVDVGGPRPLRYIAAGDAAANPIRMLRESVLRELVQGAAQEYDRVIIDSPPANLFPDAAVLSSCVDGVVVVARAGVTPFEALVDTAEHLEHAGGRMLGAVLNEVDYARDRAYDRSYRWYDQREAYGVEEPAAAPAA